MDKTKRGVPVPKGTKSSHNIMQVVNRDGENKNTKIKGTVVLMKKNVLDFNDLTASVLDRVHEVFGQGVSLQLISAVNSDSGKVALLWQLPYFTSFFLALLVPYFTSFFQNYK